MSHRQRVSYQTPPPSPHRSPPRRNPDISPPGGGPSRSSQQDPRSQKTLSSSGQRASSTKRGDQPKGPPGSRYAVSRSSVPPRDDPKSKQTPSPPRGEALYVPPLHSMAPPTVPQQRPSAPPPVVPTKGKSTKGTRSLIHRRTSLLKGKPRR
ncbi:serine/arginine repetitive matrix protein 1-like [Papaver somniferum]|uniref:serine/arginine repetitive matrix protein 1-like n=1 Tax=Papaver somniferum TaxID=3469 RepID=UPI000E70490B|nr:serine/arginine repetitive matrix protein 1-like [Papaver somniferum]